MNPASLAHQLTARQKQSHEHARAAVTCVGGDAARVAVTSAGARVTNSKDAKFDIL
jgi:hypothetical protein